MGSFAAPIVNAAMAKTTSFISMERQRAEQLQQASDMEDRADLLRRQGRIAAEIGEREAYRLDSQKSLLRRQYNDVQGHNRASLGAGNVDMASGSAALVSEGNANRFAAEMGENAYNVAMKRWETEEQKRMTEYQAAQFDAQSSYLKRTAGNLLTSWLMSDMAGASAFFGGGGTQAIQGAIEKNRSSQQLYYDPALQKYTASNPRH